MKTVFNAIIVLATLAISSCDIKLSQEDGESPKPTVTAVNARTQFLEVKGRTLAYRTIGNGTPLLLCNRFRGNLDTWDPAFLDTLAQQYQVVIFDYSGFGLSTGEPATNMKSFAADVRDIAEAMGFEKVILGGWSFGGMVVQTCIALYPELASHGILIGTGPPGKNEAPIEPVFFEKSRILHNTLDDEMVLFFEPQWQASRAAAVRSHERIAQRTADRDSIIAERLWGNYSKGFEDYVADQDGIRERLLTSTVPTLVISGDHDISFPVQNWYALLRKLQSTQIIVIPMAGHGPQHEFPGLVARYIGDFIQHKR